MRRIRALSHAMQLLCDQRINGNTLEIYKDSKQFVHALHDIWSSITDELSNDPHIQEITDGIQG